MFFKKTENHNENKGLIKVAALLIHAAKIDENYSQHEEIGRAHVRTPVTA